MGENVSRGKQFEEQIRKSFEKVAQTSVDRLSDPMSGFMGHRNVCDFMVYHYPTLYYIECKSCYGNTFPYSNITDNQWNGLLEKSKINGVIAGYMIWFVSHDITIFVSAENLAKYRENRLKSIHIDDVRKGSFYILKGKKKRILFDYDLIDFIDKFKTGENNESKNV